MKHTVQDVLRMAGHLLADPKRHCVASFARNAEGRYVTSSYVTAPEACSWCLHGAVIACARVLGFDDNAIMAIQDSLPPWDTWDDGDTGRRMRLAAKLRSA